MSDDKYQLCPCGSGKKLKFCSYETHRTLCVSDEDLFRRASEFRIYGSLKKVIKLDGAKGKVGRRAKADLEAFASSIRQSSGLTLDSFLEDAERFDHAFRCLMDGRFEQAVRGFNLVLESEPDHVQSHGNLGVAYAALGNQAAAIRHLDKAIELDPHYEPAIDNRRVILALQPGERLNCGQTRQVDFYADRYRAQQSSSPMAGPIRFSQSR